MTPTRKPSPDALLAGLNEAIGLSRDLLHGLQHEQEDLQAWRLEHIEQSIETRTRTLLVLEQCMRGLLEPFGDEGAQGLRQHLDQLGGAERELASAWQELQQLGNDLERQSKINHGLVFQGRQMMQRAIGDLVGKGDAPDLYSPTGENHAQASRLIGLA